MAKRRVGVEYSPSMLEPMRPGAVSPDRALCLPTFSHFLFVNKLLSLSLSLCKSVFTSFRRCLLLQPLILNQLLPLHSLLHELLPLHSLLHGVLLSCLGEGGGEFGAHRCII